MDSFFVRDIQKLFAFRNPDKFTALFEYVLRQSGGLLETTKASSALGISRATIDAHLQALEATHAVTIIRPFFGGGQKEIVKTPKIYAFDTGFVSFSRGWDPSPGRLRYSMGTSSPRILQCCAPAFDIYYWRDTSGREIDFIIRGTRSALDVLECKWDPRRFEPDALKAFRARYPAGKNYLICPDAGPGYKKSISGLDIDIVNPRQWLDRHKRKGTDMP